VAVFTITVYFARFPLVVRLIGLRLVLMAMMAKMRCVRLVVFAIHGSGGPGILERQHHQQKDQKQFFHGLDDITGCQPLNAKRLF
jgi:hypothetical protein